MTRIAEYLEMISQGVDPATGEVLDINELKKDPSVIHAFIQLKRAFKKYHIDSRYFSYEKQFPHSVIVMKEGYFYAAHNASAIVLNQILGYKTFVDSCGRITTGGPNIDKILTALEEKDFRYTFVEKGAIVRQTGSSDPFERLHIDTLSCLPPHLLSAKLADQNKDAYPNNILTKLMGEGAVIKHPEGIEERLERAARYALFNRESEMVRLHFKFGRTRQEIADTYGLSSERIRQLLNRSIKKLQRSDIRAYLVGEVQELPASNRRGVTQETNAVPMITVADNDSISISELARRFTEKNSAGRKVTYRDIATWLIEQGFLVEERRDTDSLLRRPTALGENLGIYTEKRVGENGEYLAVLLNKSAQEFIIKYLDTVYQSGK